MKQGLSIALLIIGAILLIYGFVAADSFESEVSEAVSGTPSDRSVWFFVLGIIALLVGGGGLLMGRK